MNDFQKSQLAKAQKVAADHGGECLSKEYTRSGDKMKWRCAKGHEWESRYGHVINGSWCPECNGNGEVSIKKVETIIKKRGGKCLTKTCAKSTDKIKVRCAHGHTWHASYNSLVGKRSSWCPYCVKNSRKTLEDAVILAEKNKGCCLAEKFTRANDKILWMCEFGHKWMMSYSCVGQGQWCPYCAGNAKKTLKNAIDLALSRGGECLSTEYVNARTNLKWKCSKGHIWEASYCAIRAGGWCPKCSSGKTQRKLQSLLDYLFAKKSETIAPGWLKNPETGHNLEIDIYFPDLKIAIEYNGAQHYEKVNWTGIMTNEETEEAFKSQKRRDRLKKQLIKKNPDKVENFIIFTYKDKITEDVVRKKLLKHGIDPDKIYYEQLYRWAL